MKLPAFSVFFVGLVHCSRDPQVQISAKIKLKLGPTILFKHLKIILLQCIQFLVFNNKWYPNRSLIEMVKHFVSGSGTSEHGPIYGQMYSTNPITKNCWHCGVGRKNPICMFILVYALQTSKLYKKHMAGFETSCQHFGATCIE